MRLGRGAFYLYRIIYMPIRVTALVYEFTMFPTKEARKMTTQVESLPKYTRKEEFWNSITHYSGFILGIVAMIFFLTYGLVNNLGFKIIFPFMIYTIFMMMMFFVSGFYHSRRLGSRSRAIARKIDHSDIYAFIGATYTPICLLSVANTKVGIILLIVEIVFDIAGLVFSLVPSDKKAFGLLGYFCYIVAGWLVIFVFPFNIGIPLDVFLWVLAGGIAYTIGAILYAVGHRKRWFHTVFHFFVLAGAALQFVGVLLIILAK